MQWETVWLCWVMTHFASVTDCCTRSSNKFTLLSDCFVQLTWQRRVQFTVNKSSRTLNRISKKRYPVTDSKALWGGGGGRNLGLHALDLGARRWWVVSTTPRPLCPRERPGTHCTGGWVGPRAGLDMCEKISPLPGFDSRTVQLVASRYTDRAIPAPLTQSVLVIK
jgi:hypothetical protein